MSATGPGPSRNDYGSYGSYFSVDAVSGPSPPPAPAPGDIGVLPSNPAPTPVSDGPSPLHTTSTEAFRQVTAATSQSTSTSVIDTTIMTSTKTTTTTTSVLLQCTETRNAVPCEYNGKCAVDPVSGWPFCWTSPEDWVSSSATLCL